LHSKYELHSRIYRCNAMASVPTTPSASLSTISWSSDWPEAEHGDAKFRGAGGAACARRLCSASTAAESGRWPRESDEDRDCRRARGQEGPGVDFAAAYELLDSVLGTGASGGVRAARCRRTGRRVAVKRLALRGEPIAALADLEREVEVHSSLDHPNIVPLEAVFESEEAIHLVLERLDGGDAFDRLLEHGRFAERDTARLCVQVLRALSYLHAHSIVHRDLKPENIMYADRSFEQVKLIDFGFSTRVARRRGLYERCGTLQYVAPEVLTGEGYDEKSDVWSLGTVCYTLLTGKALYGGCELEVQRKNRLGAVDFSEAFRAVSSSAQDFVRGLLAVDVTRRPSAEEALRHPWLAQHAPELVAAAVAESQGRHAGKATLRARCAAPAAEPLSRSASTCRSKAPRVSARLDEVLGADRVAYQAAPTCFAYVAKLFAKRRRSNTTPAAARGRCAAEQLLRTVRGRGRHSDDVLQVSSTLFG